MLSDFKVYFLLYMRINIYLGASSQKSNSSFHSGDLYFV